MGQPWPLWLSCPGKSGFLPQYTGHPLLLVPLGSQSSLWAHFFLALFTLPLSPGFSCSPIGIQTDCASENDLELQIFLPPHPKCWVCRCVPSHLYMWCWGLNPGLCAHYANTWPTELHSQSLFPHLLDMLTYSHPTLTPRYLELMSVNNGPGN